MIKRILACVTVLALTLVMGGCDQSKNDYLIIYNSNGDDSASEKVSITFFGYKADAMNLTAIEAAMQSFMSEHKNIIIYYEGIKGTPYWQAFNKRDAAGVLDDVLMMNHDHIISMTAERKLADLSDLPGLENYSEEARIQFIGSDGSVYFLPTCISTYNLYVNYDLLEAHGQKVPENWDEFQRCCDYFVSVGIVPIIANNYNSIATLISSKGLYDTYQRHDVESVLEQFNEDPALLVEALTPGVEQAEEMLSRGWFDAAETLVTEQTSDDLELFAKGDRPFMISGGWASIRVKAMEPAFSYGVHPYPILDDGCVLSSQVDTCISININSPHLKEAKEFVSYLIEPDVMWGYCNSQASYTPLTDERLPSESTLLPSMEYLTNGREVFRGDYRLELHLETALAECANALLRGGTVEEAKSVLLNVLLK